VDWFSPYYWFNKFFTEYNDVSIALEKAMHEVGVGCEVFASEFWLIELSEYFCISIPVLP
jgi:hypothetical protein